MLSAAKEINDAWLAPSRELNIKINIAGEVFDRESVTSLSFDSGSIVGESFQIGSAYMNQIGLEFPGIIQTIERDLELTIELGILVNGNFHYSKIGTFIVSEFNRSHNDKKTTLTAVDKMCLLEGQYVSKLTYPARIRDVALEIANLAGVEIDQVSFSTLPTATIKKMEGYTYRQAIGLIAQFIGGFANFSRDGKLQVIRLAPTDFTLTGDHYMLKGFTKNESTYRINGIKVITGDEESNVLTVGSNKGNIVELENKVMTQALLNSIWANVKDISYFPFELKWVGNPNLEAGDWMYVIDLEGNRYSVPNLSYSFNYNGGLRADSKATTTSNSEVTYRYRGTLKQQIEEIKGVLEGANGWNSNYYDSETEPPNPKIGDLWFKKNGADNEIWIYRLVDGVAKWELEISSAPNQELLDAIQEAIDASNAAKQAGEEAKAAGERAEQLGNEAKQVGEEAKQAGEAAKAEAELAKQAGEEAKVAGQRAESLAGQAKTESATAITNANNAVSKANQAVEDAGFSKTLAQDAKQLADEAKQDALNAVSQAGTAKQIAESASSAVTSAVTTANQAKQDAINAIGQAGTAITDAKAALDAYNNMEIGGRNWLLNSNKDFAKAIVGVWTGSLLQQVSLETMNAKVGDELTFSIYLKVPQTAPKGVSARITAYREDGNYVVATGNIIPVNSEGVSSVTFKITNSNFHKVDCVLQRQNADGTGESFLIDRKEEMLTKGNVVLDWTPAPEDVQVQISTINGELSQKVSQTTFNTLQGTVSGQGTQINQNKSDIALKANQSTVNTLTGRVSTAEGQINVQAGQIAQRLTATQVESLVDGKGYATQTSVNSQVSTINGKLNEHTSQLSTVTAKVDEMQIGGRNWFLNSNKEFVNSNVAEYWGAIGAEILFETMGLKIGDDVTFSVYLKVPTNAPAGVAARINFYRSDNTYIQKYGNYILPGKEGVSSATFKIPDSSNPFTSVRLALQRQNADGTGNVFTVQRKEEMFTKGNVVLDWTPAPEDTATVAEVTSKTNTINQRITDTENSITAVVNTTSTQGGKITSLESRVSVAEGSITATNTKATNNSTEISTLKTSYSGLQSTVSSVRNDLDNLDINDRNVIKVSKLESTFSGGWGATYMKVEFVSNNVGSWYAKLTKNVDTTDRAFLQTFTYKLTDIDLSVGQDITLSLQEFVHENLTGSNNIFVRCFDSSGSIIQDICLMQFRNGSFYKISSNTGKIPANTDSIRVIAAISGLNGCLRFNHVKLQRGNKATAWSPAWEDVTSVTEFSDFKQDVDGFKQTVSSTYAKQTALNTVEQTVNSTTQTIATIQTDLSGKATVTSVNSIKDTVDSHTQTISSHNGRITTAQQTADGAKTTATDAQGRVSTVEQKVSGLQTTVADKADKSQITQLSGQITSTVNSLNNLDSPGANLIMNGGFESGTIGWSGIRELHSTSRSGDKALISRDWGTTVVTQTNFISVEPGRKYEISYWYTTSTDANGTLDNQKLRIGRKDGSLIIAYGWSGAATTWTQMKRIWTCPANVNEIRVTMQFNNTVGWVRVDDISIVDVTDREAAQSQITQLARDINLRVTKDGLIGEINISAGKTIIRQSDNVVMITPTTTYIQDATIKNAHIADLAVTNAKIGNLAVNEGKIANAAITTLKVADAAISNAKIANLAVDGAKIASLAVDTGHIKDLAVSNAKIANLAVSNAKIADAAITSAKIGDAAIVNAKIANGAINDAKIQDASISSAKIISLDANKISANDLRSISSQTGALEVTGWLDFSSDNRGVRGSYNFGDDYIGAYNSRWFDGDFRMSHRYLMFKSQVYDVTSNNTRGAYRYHTESFYGPDYFKLRQYSNSSMSTLLNHVDITADAIIIGDRDWATRAIINADGSAMFNGRVSFNSGIDIGAPDNIGLSVGRINAPSNYSSLTINQNRALADVVFGEQNIYFNETRTIAADFRIGRDGSNINGGRVVASNAIYNRTYSGAANMIITPEGVLGRSTSALKYKDDVRTANDVMSKAKKVIQLQPKSWLDKGELADGVATKRHYGFIADEFDALGLSEVVIYGDHGQVESLAYDRISMYHNVILKEHESEIQSMKYGNFERDFEIQKLKFEIQKLNMEIESLRQTA